MTPEQALRLLKIVMGSQEDAPAPLSVKHANTPSAESSWRQSYSAACERQSDRQDAPVGGTSLSIAAA